MALNTKALQQRLRVIDDEIEKTKILLHDKSIDSVMHPERPELKVEAEQLDAELAAHQRELVRVAAAIEVSRERESLEGRRARMAQLFEHHATVDSTGKRMAVIAEKIIEQIDGLGPLLSEFATLSDQRRALASQVVSEAARGVRHHKTGYFRDRYAESAHWRSKVVSPAVVAALWRSELGRLGLDLSSWVTISPPAWDGRYARGDLIAALREDIAKVDKRLAHGMKEGLQSVAAEIVDAQGRQRAELAP